jgi:hypothetical protein
MAGDGHKGNSRASARKAALKFLKISGDAPRTHTRTDGTTFRRKSQWSAEILGLVNDMGGTPISGKRASCIIEGLFPASSSHILGPTSIHSIMTASPPTSPAPVKTNRSLSASARRFLASRARNH